MRQYRIAEARTRRGWSQRELAARAGMSQQQISYYECGDRDPRGKAIIALCKALDVSATYLLGMSDDPASTHPDNFLAVPLFGSIAAGTPLRMESANERFPIPGVLRNRYPHAFLLRIEGESMNRILPNGCFALVDPCTEVEYDGQPYAVRVGDLDATVKRVLLLADGLELMPDSTDSSFVPQRFAYGDKGASTLTVIGRVVWHCLPYDWTY